jgi:hypothetical protein
MMGWLGKRSKCIEYSGPSLERWVLRSVGQSSDVYTGKHVIYSTGTMSSCLRVESAL